MRYLILLSFCFAKIGFILAQCPTNGTIFLSGNIDIEENCTFSTDHILSSANILVKDGFSLTINFTGAGSSTFDQLNGSIALESTTAQFTINGKAIFEDLSISIADGATMTITDETTIGAFSSPFTTTLDIEGSLIVESDLIFNTASTLTGSTGEISVTNNIIDNGLDHSGFNGNILCGGNCASLPVDLVTFYAQRDGNIIDLAWVTASEQDNEGFEIQKSFDGLHFQDVDFVEGNGTVNHTVHYQYSLNENASQVYFRLKQFDFDGKYTYSHTIRVDNTRKDDQSIATLYPSTVTFEIHLSSEQTNDKLFKGQIIDQAGKTHLTINQWMTLDDLSHVINQRIGDLQNSMYMLLLYSEEGSQTLRFYKR